MCALNNYYIFKQVKVICKMQTNKYMYYSKSILWIKVASFSPMRDVNDALSQFQPFLHEVHLYALLIHILLSVASLTFRLILSQVLKELFFLVC